MAIVRGEPRACVAWLEEQVATRAGVAIAVIFAGCGLYGAAMGSWRDPLMGVYVGAKFPLLICLTLVVNGLINGMLAQVLGSRLSFAQSLQCQLMSFMTFALMLGALSPIAFLMVGNAPAFDSPDRQQAHDVLLLVHTTIIAYAGIVSNYKLFRMLEFRTGNRAVACQTLFCWLAGNLFVGAQLSYNLRPFFGTPGLKVQFLRWGEIFNKTFYEAILETINRTLTN